MIVVHHARRARSVRVIWLLEELAVPYEVVAVEFTRERLGSEEYRRLHPLGQVPAVEIDGQMMIESGAILELLLEQHGHGRLAPAPGSAARGEYLQWFHFGEASLAKHIGEIVRNRFTRPEAERIPAIVTDARERLLSALGLVDKVLEGRAYVLGDAFTAADIMLSYGITMSRITGELPKELENLAGYLGRLKDRSGYQKAWA